MMWGWCGRLGVGWWRRMKQPDKEGKPSAVGATAFQAALVGR